MCIVKVPVNKSKVQCIVSSHSHTRVSHCLHFSDTKTDLYTRYRHQTIRNRFATRAAPWWVWVLTTVSNPCCHLVSYSGYAPFMHRLYIPGHYVQTWRHLQHRKHINASQSRSRGGPSHGHSWRAKFWSRSDLWFLRYAHGETSIIISQYSNSHHPPDTTKQSSLCRVWRGGVN